MKSGGVKIEIVDTMGGLEAIRPEWEELWARCPEATPFQSPGWLIPWWRHFGGKGLLAIAVRSGGRLAGLAPFFVYAPAGGMRKVMFAGTGITDYLDILLEPGKEKMLERILGLLADLRPLWDLCDMQELRSRSALLSASFPEGLNASALPMGTTMMIELPDRVEDLPEAFSAKFRKRLRGARKSLETLGALASSAGPGDMVEFIDDLFLLHGLRWKARGMEGMLSSETIRSFHREAALEMMSAGRLRIHRLSMKGSPLAVLYSFACKGRTYAYLSGFAPGPFDRFSPGRCLMAHAIEDAIREGSREYDFLRGDEEYKRHWKAVESHNFRVIITKDGTGG